MSGKHTPGHWTNQNGKVYDANGRLICSVEGHGYDPNNCAACANAHLIAAAPELLEAAEDILDHTAGIFGCDVNEVRAINMGRLERLAAAIAKARGES